MFITITGMNHYLGIEVFRIDQVLYLEKEETNPNDDEAIKVMIDGGAVAGYVANSTYTKAMGTKSAGYIHHSFDKEIKAKVMFITRDTVIAKLLV
ncbi:HIRAN domain-containing protein [Amedibacillus sp. YH-ame6]